MDAQRILPGNSGGQQPSKDHPGMELSTEGDFNCVQNKKAKNEVVLCSVNSACNRDLKNTIYFFSCWSFNSVLYKELLHSKGIKPTEEKDNLWTTKIFANHISDKQPISQIYINKLLEFNSREKNSSIKK